MPWWAIPTNELRESEEHMAYDLEEQEQIAGLRAFWDQYGNFILSGVVVVLLAVAGWRGWGWYQDSQAAQASAVYERLQAAAEAKDMDRVKEAAGTLFEKFGGTAYGPMGAVVAARAWTDAGDLKAARAPLQWLVDKGGDDEFVQLARVRLAGILLDEKQYDEGLKVLASGTVSARYAGVNADRRGDLLLAQGKKAEARKAWEECLSKLEDTSPLRRLVRLKLDSLAGEGA